MPNEEGEALLDLLWEAATQPELSWTQADWQPGDVLMWDNRCTQHCATSDSHGHRREMLRTTVKGARPKGLTG